MNNLEAVVLGVTQGLTEFLPVSSSGHLVLVPEFLGMSTPTVAFDVLLHLATLVAVVGYFARDWYCMAVAFVAPGRLPGKTAATWRRLAIWLAVGTVPAALAGVLLQSFFESLFASTLAVGIFLILTGCLLTLADLVAGRAERRRRTLDDMGLLDALLIGCYQALAIAPGLSRSGATISGGVFLGLDRPAAARFSFLMSVPVILGAGLVSARDLSAGIQGGDAVAYALGAVAALVSGLVAIHVLLRYLRSHGLWPFAVYAFVLGGLVVVLSLI